MFDIHLYEFFVEYELNQLVVLLMYNNPHVLYENYFSKDKMI